MSDQALRSPEVTTAGTAGGPPAAGLVVGPEDAAAPVVRLSSGRALIATALLVLAGIGSFLVLPPVVAGGAALLVSVLYLTRRAVFSWRGGLVALALVVLVVPVRRYRLPIDLGFALEPYRIIIPGLVVAVVIALLIDPAFRWKPIRFGWPVGLFLGSMIASIVVNAYRLNDEELLGLSLGNLFQMFIMLSVLFITRQLLRSAADVILLVRLLAWAGGAIGFFALVERFTHINVFVKLHDVLPLVLMSDPTVITRGGGARAFGSSTHPISLAMLLCMLLPLAVYLAVHERFPRNAINRATLHAVPALMICGGIVATASRTAFVALGVAMLITLVLIPRFARKIVLTALPFVLLLAVALPGLFASTIGSFLDPASLIESQYASPGWSGQGRLADVGPTMELVAQNPILGIGFGSRITSGDGTNAIILDNQLLGQLVETGYIGAAALLIFLLWPVVRLIRYAFTRGVETRWAHLAFAIACSVVTYAVSVYFIDAWGHPQPFFVLMMLLAVGGWLLSERPGTGTSAGSASGNASAGSTAEVAPAQTLASAPTLATAEVTP